MTSWAKTQYDDAGRDGYGAWSPRARYGFADYVVLLWGEMKIMVPVFLVIVFIGLACAVVFLKSSYTAYRSVVVQVGQEYVYQPLLGDAGRGAVPLTSAMVDSEVGLLTSADLHQRVLNQLTLPYVFPKMAEKYRAATPAARAEMMDKAIEEFSKGLVVEPAPESATIALSFKASSAEVAARTLNTLVETYMAERGAILTGGEAARLMAQRGRFEVQLADADARYQDFLRTNDIADFNATKAALTAQLQQATQDRYATAAKLATSRAQLAAISGQVSNLPPEVPQYRDTNTNASDQLAGLQTQRANLASVWLPGSERMRDIDAQIAALQAGMNSGQTQAEGAKRFGQNPVYQSAQTQQVTLAAEVQGLASAVAAYDAQIAEISQRLLRLAEIEPQFAQVSADRDLQIAGLKDVVAKAQQSAALQNLANAVSSPTPARAPTQGSSLKRPVAILAVLFGGFTALCLGLLRVLTRPGLPTASAASRTLDLPILGAATVKAR